MLHGTQSVMMEKKKKALSEGKHFYNESSLFVVSKSLYSDLLVERHIKKGAYTSTGYFFRLFLYNTNPAAFSCHESYM